MELVFVSVGELTIRHTEYYEEGHGNVEDITRPVKRREITFNCDSNLIIKSERAFYRFRRDWLGPQSFLHGAVPAPEAVPATPIEGLWRQCSECCDAWEHNLEEIYAYCPSCRSLTRLTQ